ncbi:MAG: hypothetical protein EKK31_01240 [Hyphomicrobiales bacterium]|nr:MAG: hypothetical protein EKK31_01240 [Hyphomicrobiales bacterium]
MAVFTLAVSSTGLLAAYTDPTVLTIEGQQQHPLEQYSVDHLRSDFENVVVETRTPWTKEGEQIKYRGPHILDVLRKHGLDGADSIQFVAFDNFVSEIMLSEIKAYGPIFAIDRACQDADRKRGRCKTGQEFTALTKEEQGPIFLVWPYDQLPSDYVPARNSIWVWFVVAVRPLQ